MPRIQVTARPDLAEAQGGPLQYIKVLFEDEFLLALEKPRAMHSITLTPEDSLTLADCVAAYCPQCLGASADQREAGLVQRLDHFTSGVILAAKTPGVWQSLHQMLIGNEVQKTYLALVEGTLAVAEVHISLPLRQSKGGKKMIAVRTSKARTNNFAAKTNIEGVGTLAFEGDRTVSIGRARARHVARHQIRVHLASFGHPLVGDKLYGAKWELAELLREVSPNEIVDNRSIDGFLLHAERVEFIHPVSREPICVTSNSRVFEQLLRQTQNSSISGDDNECMTKQL